MRTGPFTIAVAAALLAAAAPAQRSVAELAWLSGAWVSQTGEGWTEELWTAPRGGVMLGVGRAGKGERVTSFEYMRIAADANGTVSFWGSPGGATPVPFRLTSSSPDEAVFENPDHDFPTRIAYRREGAELIATVSGPDGRNAQSWRLQRPNRLKPTHPPVRLER